MLLLLLLLCVLWPQEAPAEVTPDYKQDGAPSGMCQLGCGCFARESADVFLLPDSTTAVCTSNNGPVSDDHSVANYILIY